jgi:hypothetical protein
MDKRKAMRRPKARKPKLLIEVQGRRLTPEQFRDFQRTFEHRRGLHAESETKSERAALEEVLWNARPSVRAYKQLETLALWRRANEAFMTLGGFSQDRLLRSSDPKFVALANAIVGHVAREFEAVARELRAMHEAIAGETREAQS